MLSILLAVIATCCFIATIIAILVGMRLADKLERAERTIERLKAEREEYQQLDLPLFAVRGKPTPKRRTPGGAHLVGAPDDDS